MPDERLGPPASKGHVSVADVSRWRLLEQNEFGACPLTETATVRDVRLAV